MNKKLIILDFDHTIINTSYLTDATALMFENDFGITKKQFLAAREKTKKCCLVEDMDTMIGHLPYADKASLHAALHETIKNQVHTFVFPDVLDFIERHHIQGFDILISTHGDQELQTEKIQHSGIPAYVQILISTESKAKALAPYVKEYNAVHFIDDKTQNLDAVKQALPSVITYFLRRPQDCKYCHIAPSDGNADHVIADLSLTLSS